MLLTCEIIGKQLNIYSFYDKGFGRKEGVECVCVCTHAHMCVCMHTHVRMCVHACMYVCVTNRAVFVRMAHG